MSNTDYPVTAVASGSELFLRFITLAALDHKVSVDDVIARDLLQTCYYL